MPNMAVELRDIAARLGPAQSLHLLLYSSGSGCGQPSTKYTADAMKELLPLIDRSAASSNGLRLDGVFNYVTVSSHAFSTLAIASS